MSGISAGRIFRMLLRNGGDFFSEAKVAVCLPHGAGDAAEEKTGGSCLVSGGRKKFSGRRKFLFGVLQVPFRLGEGGLINIYGCVWADIQVFFIPLPHLWINIIYYVPGCCSFFGSYRLVIS